MPVEVNISKHEILFLKNNIHAHLKQYNKEKKKTVRFAPNSSPESYKEIVKIINDSKDIKENFVRQTFMRDLFHTFRNGKTVRKHSINKLYYFLFDTSRRKYLSKNPSAFFSENNKFYSLRELTISQKTLLEESLDVPLDFKTDIRSDVLISESKDVRSKTYILIDDAFLTNIYSVLMLIDLFTEHFVPMMLDYNIEFVLSDEITLGNNVDSRAIDSFDGIISYVQFWKKREDTLSYVPHINRDLIRKLVSPVFFSVLRNVGSFNKLKNSGSQSSVNKLADMFRELYEEKEQPLKNIYEKNARFDGEDYSYLCVMGRLSYSKHKDANKMLRYFAKFAKTLEKSNKIRIFTVPGKRIKGRGWTSQLSEAENKTLHSFVHLNKELNVQTYLLFYNEEEVDKRIPTMWTQSYVVRHANGPATKNYKDLKSFEKYYSYHSLNIVVDDFEENTKSTEIYLASPLSSDGVSRVTTITSELYIQRLFENLLRQARFPQKKDEGLLINAMKLENTELRGYFNLTKLPQREYLNLTRSVVNVKNLAKEF